jgi:copper(I)-binding protein
VKKAFLLLVVSLAVLLSACQAKGFAVDNVWARPGIPGGTSAVYFEIRNLTDQSDTLLSARTDIAQAAELHVSKMNKQGVMTMEPLENVPVPALNKVDFTPGGMHVMLVNLKEALDVGQTFDLVLTFEKNGEIQLTVPVKAP